MRAKLGAHGRFEGQRIVNPADTEAAAAAGAVV
jgi:hypothetical protein